MPSSLSGSATVTLRLARWLAFDDSPCRCPDAEDRWGLLTPAAQQEYRNRAADALAYAEGRS